METNKQDADQNKKEEPMTLEQRVFQASEFIYASSKLIEGLDNLGSMRDDLLLKAESLLNYIDDSFVNITQDNIDQLVKEIKG